MTPLEIFFVGLAVVTVISRLLGYRVTQRTPPSPPNKVTWDLEREIDMRGLKLSDAASKFPVSLESPLWTKRSSEKGMQKRKTKNFLRT